MRYTLTAKTRTSMPPHHQPPCRQQQLSSHTSASASHHTPLAECSCCRRRTRAAAAACLHASCRRCLPPRMQPLQHWCADAASPRAWLHGARTAECQSKHAATATCIRAARTRDQAAMRRLDTPHLGATRHARRRKHARARTWQLDCRLQHLTVWGVGCGVWVVVWCAGALPPPSATDLAHTLPHSNRHGTRRHVRALH